MTSVRRFTVFCDAPASSAVVASSNNASTSTSSIIVLRTNTEKENINPVTGQCPSTSGPKALKDKTKALTTKFILSDSDKNSKKQKLILGVKDDSEPEPKKRRSTSSSQDGKGKSKVARTGSGRPKRTIRRPALPSVDELTIECGDSEQAAINSRCVELTVKPLADASEAYDSSGSPTTTTPSPAIATSVAASTTANLRDYFTVALSSTSVKPLDEASVSPSSSNENCPNASNKPLKAEDLYVFSTPERKKIYSAFTFSSPSPASKRLRQQPSFFDSDTAVMFDKLTLDINSLSL